MGRQLVAVAGCAEPSPTPVRFPEVEADPVTDRYEVTIELPIDEPSAVGAVVVRGYGPSGQPVREAEFTAFDDDGLATETLTCDRIPLLFDVASIKPASSGWLDDYYIPGASIGLDDAENLTLEYRPSVDPVQDARNDHQLGPSGTCVAGSVAWLRASGPPTIGRSCGPGTCRRGECISDDTHRGPGFDRLERRCLDRSSRRPRPWPLAHILLTDSKEPKEPLDAGGFLDRGSHFRGNPRGIHPYLG
jgi:hypothetical protein